jgi:cytoskeletal protein RodZ
MSRRRRREREPGRVRKTVEVLVSGLFGMAVVGVVVALMQSGASPSPSPSPTAIVSDRSFPGDGANGGPVSVRSADPGSVETTAGPVNAAATGTIPSSPAQGARGAQATGRTEPADPTTAATQSSATAQSGTSASSSSTATAGSTASSSGGGLGGLVGGVVGGVLGLL